MRLHILQQNEFCRVEILVLRILSLLVSLIVSSHYAVLLFVRLIHASSIVSFDVLFIVLHIVLLSFHILF